MTINERLEALMSALDMNAREFSQKIGVKEGTTRNYTGRGSKPSAEYLEKIYNSIENINADWLLSGQGEKFKAVQTAGDNSPAAGRDSYNTSGDVNGGFNMAGPGQQISQAPTHAPQGLDLITTFEKEIECLKRSLEDRDRIIAEKDRTIAEKENTNHTLNRMITMLENQLSTKQ